MDRTRECWKGIKRGRNQKLVFTVWGRQVGRQGTPSTTRGICSRGRDWNDNWAEGL